MAAFQQRAASKQEREAIREAWLSSFVAERHWPEVRQSIQVSYSADWQAAVTTVPAIFLPCLKHHETACSSSSSFGERKSLHSQLWFYPAFVLIAAQLFAFQRPHLSPFPSPCELMRFFLPPLNAELMYWPAVHQLLTVAIRKHFWFPSFPALAAVGGGGQALTRRSQAHPSTDSGGAHERPGGSLRSPQQIFLSSFDCQDPLLLTFGSLCWFETICGP